MTYLQSLSAELAAVGVRGRRRARIVAEFADHLDCDPDAQLGEPSEVARRFADELGTSLALRAGVRAFASLAIAGALFAAAFLAHPGALRSTTDTARPFSDFAAALVVVGPQLALAAGVLAIVRVIRRRHHAVIARAEAVVVVRRAATGLLAGVASMAGFALLALILAGRVPGWWVTVTVSLCGAGALALLVAVPSVVSAARVTPLSEGSAGDLFDDLGPLVPYRVRGRPWWLALIVAAAVAAAITIAGVVQADGYDGALRGIVDGTACLLGFALLGRFLGLRA